MSLSVKLQMRQSQSLVMTPQLMQSIRLLQFNHAELHQFIEQEVERNPLLELVGESGDAEQGQAPEPVVSDASEKPDTAVERMVESIDSDYENVYQDDHGEARPDAPELAGFGITGKLNKRRRDFLIGQISARPRLDLG